MNKKIFAAGLAYDGSAYQGWQRQAQVSSVQACVEQAIGKVAGHTVTVDCAGRTDAGVHATAQVIRFQTSSVRRLDQWLMGVNTELPSSIRLQWVQAVEDEFHPRFQAVERSYRYIIYNAKLSPCFARHLVSWYFSPLDADLMHEGAQHLLGEHDFSAFRGSDCQSKTPFRDVKAVSVVREGAYLFIDIRANAFLHHMVRNIVGALLLVGQAKRQPQWMAEVLASRDRRQAGVTALPNGLYLVGVRYPDHYHLPSAPVMPGLLSF